MEDLVIESIKMYGVAVHYIPRTFVKLDRLFGEDVLSQFDKTYPIEMYFDSVSGFEGDRNFLSKFGLEIRKQANFVVAKRRFTQVVKYDGAWSIPRNAQDDDPVRPMEGDLIYFPITNDLWEIRFVDHESVFYQLGNFYIWRLTVEKFVNSSETINTGVPEIDELGTRHANLANDVRGPAAEFEPIFINCGGVGFTGGDSTVWTQDAGYSGGVAQSTTESILGTSDQQLYQTAHTGSSPFSYEFAVPDGLYNVTLKFAEINNFSVGERSFAVDINGSKRLRKLDIVKRARGAYKAVDFVYPTAVTSGVFGESGTIKITFIPVVGNAIINGIVISRQEEMEINDPSADNLYIQAESNKILDFSEDNPFCEGGNP